MSCLGFARPGDSLGLRIVEISRAKKQLHSGQIAYTGTNPVLADLFTNRAGCGVPAMVKCQTSGPARLEDVLRQHCPSISQVGIRELCLTSTKGVVNLPWAVFRQLQLSEQKNKEYVWKEVLLAWSCYSHSDACAKCSASVAPAPECPPHHCQLCDHFSLLLGKKERLRHEHAAEWCSRLADMNVFAVRSGFLTGPLIAADTGVAPLSLLMDAATRELAAGGIAARLQLCVSRDQRTHASLSRPSIARSHLAPVFLESRCWLTSQGRCIRLTDPQKSSAFRELLAWLVQIPFLFPPSVHVQSGWEVLNCPVCHWASGHSQVSTGSPALAPGIPVAVRSFLDSRKHMERHDLFAWLRSMLRLAFVPHPQAFGEHCTDAAAPLLHISSLLLVTVAEKMVGVAVEVGEERRSLCQAVAAVWEDHMKRVYTEVYTAQATQEKPRQEMEFSVKIK